MKNNNKNHKDAIVSYKFNKDKNNRFNSFILDSFILHIKTLGFKILPNFQIYSEDKLITDLYALSGDELVFGIALNYNISNVKFIDSDPPKWEISKEEIIVSPIYIFEQALTNVIAMANKAFNKHIPFGIRAVILVDDNDSNKFLEIQKKHENKIIRNYTGQ